MSDEECPFTCTDQPSREPPTWPCPKCGADAHLSYLDCDVEPYPYKGVLKECSVCDHIWDDVSDTA